MDFWQSVATFSLIFGLISSLVAVVSFFVDVRTLKHKHKVLLISMPIAIIFVVGGATSFVYRLTPSTNANSAHIKVATTTSTTSTTATSVPATIPILATAPTYPIVTVTSSPTATTAITPTSPSSTSILPTNQKLPLAIPCVSGSCSGFPFTLSLNSIKTDSINKGTDWVFALMNSGSSNCGSVAFSPTPTLGSSQAQGQTGDWAMSQGQQLPVTMIFPQPQTGVQYDLNLKLVFQKCLPASGGHSNGNNTYQTEPFIF